MVTKKRLEELFDFDPRTGLFVRKIAPGKRSDLIGTVAGCPTPQGYILIAVDNEKFKAHRLAWFWVHGRWPKGDLDHRNNVKHDNRIANLREATRGQNMWNTRRRRNNTSGTTGVYWSKCARKWQAYIVRDGRSRYLGIFEHIKDAIAARRAAERELHGEFAYEDDPVGHQAQTTNRGRR